MIFYAFNSFEFYSCYPAGTPQFSEINITNFIQLGSVASGLIKIKEKNSHYNKYYRVGK